LGVLTLDALLTLLAAAVSATLAAFTVRRLILLLAVRTMTSDSPLRDVDDLPVVTLVIPAHNEEAASTPLFRALERLDYPSERLSIVLASDGSTDATVERFTRWTKPRRRCRTIVLRQQVGKARALNEVLAQLDSDIVAVLDADLRPHRDFLRRIVSPFRDPSVGGVAGLIQPDGAGTNLVTRYAALECWLHQLVTSAGKDRLGLNPPTLGASAYRLEALRQVHFFPRVPQGEDVGITVALTRAGWTTRFVPDAIAESATVRTLGEYWRQHIRWSRGSFSAIGPPQVKTTAVRLEPRKRLRLASGRMFARRVEMYALSASYLDRVALLASVALVAVDALPLWLPAAYLGLAAVEAYTALRIARVPPHPYLASVAVMFPIDAIASVAAALLHALRRPSQWQSPSRQLEATTIEPEASNR
jgi:cellulose synthase/poly-beta-1,6-N-acetylglucosamine synthase-like glycosyltransferase